MGWGCGWAGVACGIELRFGLRGMVLGGQMMLAARGLLAAFEFETCHTCPQGKDVVLDTPLLLAVGSHQDRVVRALLDKGCTATEANTAGMHAGQRGLNHRGRLQWLHC